MPFQLVMPGSCGIYYGPPRFILVLAQPQHLSPQEAPQQPPRIEIVRVEEMPQWLWERIALPPQFVPPTAVAVMPPTAVPTTPPVITRRTDISDLNSANTG